MTQASDFNHHQKLDAIKATILNAAMTVAHQLPKSRERDRFIQAMREAQEWANKATIKPTR